jgi:hypothetical protein
VATLVVFAAFLLATTIQENAVKAKKRNDKRIRIAVQPPVTIRLGLTEKDKDVKSISMSFLQPATLLAEGNGMSIIRMG